MNINYTALIQAARKITHNGEVYEKNVDPEYVRGVVDLLITVSELDDEGPLGELFEVDRRMFTYLTLNIPPEWTEMYLFG